MGRINRFFHRLGIYRDTKSGWITGVCAGIANRLTVKPIWVRAAFAVIAIALHVIGPVIAYFALAFFMKPRDGAEGAASPAGVQMAYRDFAETVASPAATSPARQVTDLKSRFAALDARLNNLEAAAMSDEISLRRKFKDLGA